MGRLGFVFAVLITLGCSGTPEQSTDSTDPTDRPRDAVSDPLIDGRGSDSSDGASLQVDGGAEEDQGSTGSTDAVNEAVDGTGESEGIGPTDSTTEEGDTFSDPGRGPDDATPEPQSDTDLPTEPDGTDEPEATEPLEHCESLGLLTRAFQSEGTFGVKRHDLAADFTFYPYEGEPWVLSEHWTGCDVYIFITDARPNSALDATSIWNRDLETLLASSPLNAHYFFVETSSKTNAMSILGSMQTRVQAALDGLSEPLRSHWADRVHVAGGHYSALGGYFPAIFNGPAGFYGFAVDRRQQIRLLGSFADVTRYSDALDAGGHWPWEANMAYATHEVRHFNFEASRQERLDAEQDVTVVTAWSDEVLAQVVETDVTFPSAEEIAGFDTLEIDLTMDCPDPSGGEFGNCGAWDYLSHIYLQDANDSENWIEIARYITTYHREGRYVVDATAALAHLQGGGERRLRFDISPPWNPQAYLTTMDFRFRSQGLGYRPVGAEPLFSGANFNATYNDNFSPIEVVVPEGTTRAIISAIMTGHGMDTNNCAEFCDHHHTFTINGQAFTKTNPTVGQAEGCIGEIEAGMVPNQGGTWWFGRGGWCPGQHVTPWEIDLSGIANPGETLTIEYGATLAGMTPPDNAGNIRLSSQVIWFQ